MEPIKYLPQTSVRRCEKEEKRTINDYLFDAMQAVLFVGVGICMGFLISIASLM